MKLTRAQAHRLIELYGSRQRLTAPVREPAVERLCPESWISPLENASCLSRVSLRRAARDRHEEVSAGVADQPFHLGPRPP